MPCDRNAAGPESVLRAGALAVVAVWLSVVAHVAAGGEVPHAGLGLALLVGVSRAALQWLTMPWQMAPGPSAAGGAGVRGPPGGGIRALPAG